MQEIACCPLPVFPMPDMPFWCGKPLHQFSISQAYHLISNHSSSITGRTSWLWHSCHSECEMVVLEGAPCLLFLFFTCDFMRVYLACLWSRGYRTYVVHMSRVALCMVWANSSCLYIFDVYVPCTISGLPSIQDSWFCFWWVENSFCLSYFESTMASLKDCNATIFGRPRISLQCLIWNSIEVVVEMSSTWN